MEPLGQPIVVLNEILQAALGQNDYRQALQDMLKQMVEHLALKAASLRLLDAERQQLELAAAYRLSPEYLNKGAFEIARSDIDRQVVQAGVPVVITDLRADPRFLYPEAAGREGLVSMLVVPVRITSQVIGVLRAYTSERHAFSAEEQAFISTIAGLGAQIIQQARLYQAFRGLAYSLNSSLELRDVLSTLLVQAVQALNVRAGSLRLLEEKPGRLHLAASYGLSQAYLQKGPVQLDQSAVDRRVFEEGSPVLLHDLLKEGGFQYPEAAQREGIQSVLVLPLHIAERRVGVMRLYSGQLRSFSDEEISFAQAVADLGAVAIQNARLHALLKQRVESLKEDADGWYRFLAMG